MVALEQCNLIAWQRAKANWLNRCLADPEVFGSDPHCRRAIAPTSTRRPAPLNRIIVAITRDALVLQAEIARLSFPQPAIGGPSLIVPREKLARETEQLELVLETVEADQAEGLATASPTVAAADVEGLAGFATSLSYTLLSDRSVGAPGRRSSPRLECPPIPSTGGKPR